MAGIAVDGNLKCVDSNLASSTLLQDENSKDIFGMVISYTVKVKLFLGGEVNKNDFKNSISIRIQVLLVPLQFSSYWRRIISGIAIYIDASETEHETNYEGGHFCRKRFKNLIVH